MYISVTINLVEYNGVCPNITEGRLIKTVIDSESLCAKKIIEDFEDPHSLQNQKSFQKVSEVSKTRWAIATALNCLLWPYDKARLLKTVHALAVRHREVNSN